MNPKFPIAAALAVVLAIGAVAAAQDGPAENAASKLMAEKADSIVSVKYVLKIQIFAQGQMMGEQEANSEVRGVVLNDRGLILTSNRSFDPQIRDPRVTIKTEPTDLRILFGTEEEEYEARIVARDSNLDLAFLQILDLKDRAVTPVDLSGETKLEIGQELIGVTRLPRGFDSAPMVDRLHVTAKVERPREMWAVSGNFGAIGLPVFDHAGRAVGILSMQGGSEGVSDGPMGRGGGAAPFLLPLSVVSRIVQMAQERATEMLDSLASEGEGAGEGDTAEQPEDGGAEEEEKPAEDEPVEEKPAEEKPTGDGE